MSIIPQLIANSLIAGGIYALVALGFGIIYKTTKFFNLTHGSVTMIGGYSVYCFYKMNGCSLFLSIILGITIAGILGAVLNKIIFAPLRKRNASNLVLLVASLGVFTIIQSLVAIIFTSQFHTLADNNLPQKTYEIAGAFITQTQMIIFASVIFCAVSLMLVFKYTLFGKAVKAICDSEKTAKIVGINTDKIIARIFLLGSSIAGLTGILIGFDTGLEPAMGMKILLKGVIAVIIGGVGNIYGVIVGALILGFAENFGIYKISGEWKDTIAFILLVLFLLFRPQGLIKQK